MSRPAKSKHGPAARPCFSCPYRRDVPSGVWARSEYEKLPEYDRDTPDQPPGAFFCHQQDGRLCAGWVGCHDMNESLGLRFAGHFGTITPEDFEAALDYVCPIPLFASGTEAAAHGLAQITEPDARARRVTERLVNKAARRGEEPKYG